MPTNMNCSYIINKKKREDFYCVRSFFEDKILQIVGKSSWKLFFCLIYITTKLFSWHWILVLLYVKLFTDVRYQKDGSASSEGSLCAEQKVLVDQTSDEVQANYRLRRN
jgi:hypothetical protein